MLQASLLLIGLGLVAVLLYFGVQAQSPHSRRWIVLAVIVALPLTALLCAWNNPSLMMQVMKEQVRLQKEQSAAATQVTLNEQQAIWQAKKPGSYVMTVHTSLFCSPPHCPADQNMSVEDLFAKIHMGIAQKYSVSVTYDPELGYPTRIHLDPNPILTDQGVEYWTDQNVSYSVTDFEILR
jgi:hypothetical protein